jgi:hypothetical protein
MKRIQRLFRTPPQALPTAMLNLLIEVDNREGRAGLDRLEREIEGALRRLRATGHPQAARLALWLEALEAYRRTYHPRPRWTRLFRRPRALRRAVPASAR